MPTLAALCALALLAQLGDGPDALDVMGMLHDQQRFHEQLDSSRWRSGPMEYVDGVSAAVLQHPYTLLFDADDASLLVASFTLNHVVRLRVVNRHARSNLAHPARPFARTRTCPYRSAGRAPQDRRVQSVRIWPRARRARRHGA